jgi:hypothetical protein
MNERVKNRYAGQPYWMPDGYYKNLLDTLPYIVFETDSEGRLLYLNRKGIDRLGPENYRGTSIFPYFGGKSKKIQDGMERALEQQNTVHLSLKMAGADNRLVSTLVTLTPVILTEATPTGIDKTGNDVGRIRGLVQDMEVLDPARKERERLIMSLRTEVENIKTLKGLLPICAHCKRIRDDRGKWHLLEDYLRAHTEAEFSHGLCPECLHSLYPDLFEQQKELEFGPEDETPLCSGPV